MLNKNLLIPNDFKKDIKLAFSYALFWISVLFLTGYPTGEWPAVVALMYATLWLSREVVGLLLGHTAKHLARYGRKALRKSGFAVPVNPVQETARYYRWLIRAIALAGTELAFGVALTTGLQAAAMYDLSPFPSYLHWAAWTLFALGGVGLLIAYGIPALVFAMANFRRQEWGTNTARLYAIAEGLSQMRAWRVAF